jgi:hypothetical protein
MSNQLRIVVGMLITVSLLVFSISIQAVWSQETVKQPTKFEGAVRDVGMSQALDGCEWLDYTCGVQYIWRIPDPYGDDFFNQRFTPSECCTLMTIEIPFYDNYPEFSNTSGLGVDVIVWNSDGSGFPGTIAGTFNVPGSDLSFYPNMTSVDVSSANLVFCDDFHIGFTVVDQAQDNIAILSDDGSCGSLRSSEYYLGIWSLMLNDWGYDVNFLIFAYVCCGTSGDNCLGPIIVSAPSDLPYSDIGQYTCGRTDDYDNTCLGYYDGGEDILYQLNVTSSMIVDITMDPKGTTWSGICIDDACPPDPSTCLGMDTGSDGGPRMISNVSLSPGLYHIMVDTWPAPDCIPDFDLTINGYPGNDYISGISFQQQDFYDQAGVLVAENSFWGKVSFDIDPPTDGIVRYANITAQSEADGWIVRNFPILPSSVINAGRFSLHFDTREIGIDSGTDLSSMDYYLHVGSTVQSSGPVGTMTSTAVGAVDIIQFGRDNAHGDDYFDGPGEISPPYYYSPVDLDSLFKYRDLDTNGVPPVQEDSNECASGATARSLKWLSNRHGYGQPSAQTIQRILDDPDLMDQGVTDREMLDAKQDYINRNNLPLEVHYWYASSTYPAGIDPDYPGESSDDIDMLDWIWREMKKGQDIEVNISWARGGGHSVTLVGIDKKNMKLEYRDDESQGDDSEGDKEIKETDLVPLGRCQIGATVYITSQAVCAANGGTWLGFNGEYGFDGPHNYVDCCLAESPKSFDLGWRYHPQYVDGWLTVYGTVNCHTIDPPIFERAYVESCSTYEGYIPLWANDYLIIFEWDWWCGNVDSFKVAQPEWDGLNWYLVPFGPWLSENLPPDGITLPTLGDETGLYPNIHTVVNPSEWLADPREPLSYYTIIDGQCEYLPGYLIGTTPIIFDSSAPPDVSPFFTMPFTGILKNDGDVTFGPPSSYVVGDADGSGDVDIDDAVYLINYIFAGGPPPNPLAAGDADCSGGTDIDDVVYLINYIFAGGPPPGDPNGDGVPDC